MLVNIHFGPPRGQEERFDTLISPSGTIATLLRIEKESGADDIIGIDESYPGESKTKEKIEEIIEQDNDKRAKTYLLFTLLLYNSERTIKYIDELKNKFGGKIVTVVGGQLVPYLEKAYLKNKNIDSVCVGDAEVILPKLLRDIENKKQINKRYEGWLKDSENKKFSGVSYDRFYKIRERMTKQKKVFGFSQLTVQGPGGPGCAWAYYNSQGPCSFCALQNNTIMNRKTIREQLLEEKELKDKFNPDRLFDAANQFIPTIGKEKAEEWLTEYIRERKRLGLTDIQKYAYFITTSINKKSAELLRQAGIVEVYLGVDHFHKKALSEENKSHKCYPEKIIKECLDSLATVGIKFRIGIVLGAAKENRETLKAVSDGVDWIVRDYKNNLKAIGVFPVEIYPGSKIYYKVKKMKWCPEIFRKIDQKGYLSRKEQHELTKKYVEMNSKISFKEIKNLEQEISNKARKVGMLEYTADRA